MFDVFMNQRNIWNKIAKSWSDYRQVKVLHVVQVLEDKKGKILDLGCGSGRNFIKSTNYKIYGVDFSSEMVKLAKKYSKEKKIGAIIKKAEVYSTGYNDNFFDAVIFNAVLHCLETGEKRKAALVELFRVLKPNGEAIVSVWGKKQARVKNRSKECGVSWTIGGRKYERYCYLYSISELEKLLNKVGFEVVKSWEENNVNFIVRKPSS